MKNKIKNKKLLKNIFSSAAAQAVSLFVSFVLGLVVPKFISLESYSYWQTFLLYVSYAGVLHFGVLDGIVLRYSQYDYEELDKPVLRSQLIVVSGFVVALSALTVIVTHPWIDGKYRTILYLVLLGFLTKNIFSYSSFLFQITNRIKEYSFIVIVQRVSYGLCCILLLFKKYDDFIWLCVADIIGDIIGILVGLKANREAFFGYLPSGRIIVAETKENLSAGIKLLLSNWSAMLIVGLAKMMIQWQWGENIFGKVSFSFSLINLFLAFVSAVSIVFFPALKRTGKEQLPAIFCKARAKLPILLFGALLFFYPGGWIIEKWIPKYSDSLRYLALLMPIIVYSSENALLSSNYLKVYRNEDMLWKANVATIAATSVAYVVSVYIIRSIELTLVIVLFSTIIKAIVFDNFLFKKLNANLYKNFWLEILLTAVFVLSTYFLRRWTAFIIYAMAFAVFIGLSFLQNKKYGSR